MQRFLIIAANCVLLLFLLIGLPAAARAQVGNMQLSSASAGRTLMFCGLGFALVANFAGAVFLVKVRKRKILCWEWTGVFGALLLAYYGFARGYFNFEWLKHALQWMRGHF